MDYFKDLEKVLTQMTQELKIVKKSVNNARKDSLMISRSGKKTMYFAVSYINDERRMRLINSDQKRLYRLANKVYLRAYAKRLEANAVILRKCLNRMSPLGYRELLQDLPKHYELLDPQRVAEPKLFETDYEYPKPSPDELPIEMRLSINGCGPLEWAARPYCENRSHPEHKVHRTARGLYCRSKSEALLIGIYDRLGIPFHYDEVVTIGGVQLSPDLIGVRRDGSFIIHEHIGLYEDEYRGRNDWKRSVYAGCGFFAGVNLLYTYDSLQGALNAELAEALIRDIYAL